MPVKVAQCWDDGSVDDIRVIEILREYGAKASFNLNFGLHEEARSCSWKYLGEKEVWRLSRSELRSVYEGFTVANHGYKHLPPARVEWTDACQDIRIGREALEQHFGCEVLGYVYPGGSYNDSVMQAVRDAGHVYGRTIKMSESVLPPADSMAFHPSCDFKDEDFWDKFESAKKRDDLFYFMGHSYQIITENDWSCFRQKVARLAEESVEWVNLPELFTQPSHRDELKR